MGWGEEPSRNAVILASNAFATDVRTHQARYRRNGISAVQGVIIYLRHLISGGQPVDVFERALRQIAQSGDAR